MGGRSWLCNSKFAHFISWFLPQSYFALHCWSEIALGLSLSFCLGLRELKKVPSGICLVMLILWDLCNREFFITPSQRYGTITVDSYSYNGENDDFLVPDPKCKPFGSSWCWAFLHTCRKALFGTLNYM